MKGPKKRGRRKSGLTLSMGPVDGGATKPKERTNDKLLINVAMVGLLRRLLQRAGAEVAAAAAFNGCQESKEDYCGRPIASVYLVFVSSLVTF